MTEVTTSANASHGQGRINSRKTLALSLAHEGGPLTAMSVAPGWRFSPRHWNQGTPASSQAFHMPGMLCGPQVASELQVSRWWWQQWQLWERPASWPAAPGERLFMLT